MFDDTIVSDTFDRRFFDRLAMATNDSQKSLFLTEHIWPGVAQALADLASSGSTESPLRFIAQRLMRNKHRVARALPSEWTAWVDRERGIAMWPSLQDQIRQIFEGFTIRRQVRSKDITKILNTIDDSLCLEHYFSSSNLPTSSLPPSFDFPYFWEFLSAQNLPGGKLLIAAAAAREVKKSADRRNDELAQAEAEEAAKAAEKAAEAIRPWVELITRIREDPELRKIKHHSFMLTGSPYLATPIEVPVKGPHVSLIAQTLSLLGFTTVTKQNEVIEEIPTAWTLPLCRQWAAVQRGCSCSVADGIVDQESLCAVLDREFNALRDKIVQSWSEWVVTEDGAAEAAHGLPGGLGIALKGVQVDAEDEGKPSLKLISLRTGINMIRLNWLHEQFIALLDDGVDDYPDNPSALSKDQMMDLIEQLQPDITPEEFEIKFAQVDSDGSGQIEFDEFVEWMAASKLEIDDSN